MCCVGLPYHTLDLTHLLTYHHTEIRQALSNLSGAANLGSVFVLMVVTVDRFQNVCRPLKKQVVDFGSRRACAIAIISAIIISIPNVIIYGEGSVTKSAQGYNLTGVECFIDDEYAESTFAVAYLGFYILVFIICVLALVVLYTFICREIYRNQAFHSQDYSGNGGCFRCTSANKDGINSDSNCTIGQSEVYTMITMSESVADDDKRNVEHGVEHMDTIKEEQPIGPTDTVKNENETQHLQKLKMMALKNLF